jgi:hypothetical protein
MNNPPSNRAKPIVIQNDRLHVEIARPGARYQGSRFDWTGFITQVRLDGKHTFCASESLKAGQGTGGQGFCNEFGIETPIGYDEARPGEVFPKLGIGLLARPDDRPYNFFFPHEIVERFPLKIEENDTRVVFNQEPLNCRGYAARLKKTLSVEENELRIQYELENTGNRPIITEEYCHNFMALDNTPIGPEYHLQLAFQPRFEGPGGDLRKNLPRWMRFLPRFVVEKLVTAQLRKMASEISLEPQALRITKPPAGQFYCRLDGFQQTAQPLFRLENTSNHISVSETDNFMPMRFAVWGAPHVISAEVFKRIDLEPAQTAVWSRHYQFNVEA